MKKLRTSRRHFLQLAAGAGVATTGFDLLAKPTATATGTAAAAAPVIGDDRIYIEFDPEMRMRVSGAAKVALTGWSAADGLEVGPDTRLDRFQLKSQTRQELQGPLGKGTRLHLTGVMEAPQKLRLTVPPA